MSPPNYIVVIVVFLRLLYLEERKTNHKAMGIIPSGKSGCKSKLGTKACLHSTQIYPGHPRSNNYIFSTGFCFHRHLPTPKKKRNVLHGQMKVINITTSHDAFFPFFFFRRDINMHITERDEKYNHDRLFHHLCPAVCRMHKVLFSKAFRSRGDQQTEQPAPSQHRWPSARYLTELLC